MIWISPFLWPGYAMILGGHAWMAWRVYKESPLHALMFSFLPPYTIYYIITRWETMRVPSVIQLLGWVTIVFSIRINWPG